MTIATTQNENTFKAFSRIATLGNVQDHCVRAVIVDDDDLVRTVLKGMLERLGVDVAHAVGTAAEAKHALEHVRPEDLLFLDVNLDGERSSADIGIRAAAAGMRVIAITGSNRVPDGFPGEGILVKPITTDQLKTMLAVTVQRLRSRDP
jgi:CheY-like chemotaxis protein